MEPRRYGRRGKTGSYDCRKIARVNGFGERLSELGDRLDEILVNGDEVRTLFFVDQHVREADEKPLLFVDRVRNPIPHRRDQKIAHVSAVHRSNSDANFLPFWQGRLPPLGGRYA